MRWHEIPTRRENPEELCAQREMRELMAAEIRKLKPNVRAILQMRAFEDTSVEQTAHRLGLSTSAVKSIARRARLRLRPRLDRHRLRTA